MKIFAGGDYRLARLPYGTRLFYTLFLFFVAAGLLSCLGFIFAKSGVGSGQIAEYYRQEEMGLGGKGFLELLETSHFHLFTMPVFFLILGHIFFISSLAERTKTFVILASFSAICAEIALPWLIVYHSASWAWVKHLSRITLF